jgi:hypothetical protein
MSCPCIRSFCSHQFSLHKPQRTVSPLRRTTPAQATSRQLGTPLVARGADARGAVRTHADAAARPTEGRGGGSGAAVRRLKRAPRRGRRPSPRAGRGGPPRRPRAAPARVGIDAPHFPRTRRGRRGGPARSTPPTESRGAAPRDSARFRRGSDRRGPGPRRGRAGRAGPAPLQAVGMEEVIDRFSSGHTQSLAHGDTHGGLSSDRRDPGQRRSAAGGGSESAQPAWSEAGPPAGGRHRSFHRSILVWIRP